MMQASRAPLRIAGVQFPSLWWMEFYALKQNAKDPQEAAAACAAKILTGKYDPDKGRPTTFAATCIRNYVIDEKRAVRNKICCSLDALLVEEVGDENTPTVTIADGTLSIEDSLVLNEQTRIVLDHMNGTKDIFVRLMSGDTQAQIAHAYGVLPAAISRRIKATRKKILKNVEL